MALASSSIPRHKSDAHRLLGVLHAREKDLRAAEASLMQALEHAQEEDLAIFEALAAAQLRDILDETSRGAEGTAILSRATAKLTATPAQLEKALGQPRCWALA